MSRRSSHYFRPSLEALEDRRLLSASSFSNLGNVPVHFNLQANGHLQETMGSTHNDLGIVQGLYQGKDIKGHQVAFELVNHTLKEFTPTQGWVSLGTADRVASDGTGDVFFTQGSMLFLATGAPGHDLALLSNVRGLTTAGTHDVVQIGPYFKANLTAKLDPSSGAETLSFSNVQMNVGRFAAGFLNNAVTNLQSFTQPLGSLADNLDKPLIPGWGLTTTWLMQQLGYGDAAREIRSFADTIQAINNLPTSLTGSHSWVTLGSFSAQVKSPTQLVTISSQPSHAADITSQLGGRVSAALAQLRSIPGLTIALDDPQQLMKLITGENTTLFSYTLKVPSAISVTAHQQLAAIPVSPETLTELDVYANFGLNLSAAATFGFDTSGFRAGNFAEGFFIQNANATASLTAGLSGLLNEANLAGYQVTGEATGSITASLRGADRSGKLYLNQIEHGGITFSAPSWSDGLSAKALGPQQMLTLAIQQYDPYVKELLGSDAQIAANILKGKSVSFTNIAQVLGSLYGVPPEVTAGVLTRLNATAAQVAGALKSAFHTDALQAAGVLSDIGVGASDIASALRHDFGDTDQAAARILNQVGTSGSDIAQALQSVYHDTDQAAAYWMHQAGVGASEIASALGHVFGDTGQVAASVLNQAGVAVNNVTQGIQSVYQHGSQAVTSALNQAGAAANNVATDVGNAYQDGIQTVDNGLQSAGTAVQGGIDAVSSWI